MYDIEQYRASNTMDIFYDVINDNRFIKHYKTGFSEIDRVTSGGFETGFGIINGVSSAGKTTLVTQIAYNMSEYGQPVIIFSLEMEKTALLAKSISMQSFKNHTSLFTANEILSKDYMKNKTNQEMIDYRRIALDCGEATKNLIIVDRNTLGKSISADIVMDFVNDFMKQTGLKPVVFIDYLQRLAPCEEKKASSKQEIIDDSIDKLWGFSHMNDLCIVAISSLNRMSYKEGATLEGNKGSGNIEYSADFGLGIQFEGFDQPDFNFNDAKKAPIRKVELVILKQRLGSAGYAIPYDYYAAYNIFTTNNEIYNNSNNDYIEFTTLNNLSENEKTFKKSQVNQENLCIINNEDVNIQVRDNIDDKRNDLLPFVKNPFKKDNSTSSNKVDLSFNL